MHCTSCEKHLGWDWLEDECIDPNEEFEYTDCGENLRYEIDEGTYLGAQHVTIEVVDD